ncbi:unnamed protein product [Symbiodinium sp. CCMP2592]|nr:unnamed protein product [Symbiodinium sp. CCMP2592]
MKASHGKRSTVAGIPRMEESCRTGALEFHICETWDLETKTGRARQFLKQGGILCGCISGYSHASQARFLFRDDFGQGLDKWPEEAILRPGGGAERAFVRSGAEEAGESAEGGTAPRLLEPRLFGFCWLSCPAETRIVKSYCLLPPADSFVLLLRGASQYRRKRASGCRV